jgi:type I restriction-modification system DNA methylase subunit
MTTCGYITIPEEMSFVTIQSNQSISNRESLRDKIHEIHNHLRNNGAGYGMNALKVFNVIYGLKKIEENGLIDIVGLARPECEFSYLLKRANENDDEQFAELILDKVLGSIHNSNIKHLLFYEIPTNIRAAVFVYLIKEIDKITLIEKTCNVNLCGKIYEYFIGRDESAISELGAYFTDRHIVDFILNKLNPQIEEDGTIGTMIDMFGGSGGFTIGYIDWLMKAYPERINWVIELGKVHHYDMNEDVIKSAGLEFLCLTHVLPFMENLKYKNSFKDEFMDEHKKYKKYKYPLTNPPYGGDKTNKSGAQIKRDKVKAFIKAELKTATDETILSHRREQLKRIEAQERQEKRENEKSKVSVEMCSGRIQRFAKNNGELKGNDKESCSLMLLMDIVDVGGTAIGVLKEGVFFNKSYRELRKCLIEKFNVREVISVPQDQFENTSTKTSIVIFDNTPEQTTREVRFSELVVERYQEDTFGETVEGDIVIVDNKGDIKGVSDVLISCASREELLTNEIYSLNAKDYQIIKNHFSNCYSFYNFDDLCEIRLGTRITKSNAINGDIPVYGGGDITFYTNKSNRDGNTLIISRYALSNTCVRLIDSKFYLNDSGMSIHTKNESQQHYINFWLLSEHCQNFIYKNCTSGSIQKNINMNLLKKMQIPLPKTPEKMRQIVESISEPWNQKSTMEKCMHELELFVKNKIIEITENNECEDIELGKLCELTSGKFKSSDCNKTGLYPFYNGKAMQPDGYSDKYCYDEKEYIILIKDGGAGYGIYGEQIGLGNVYLCNGKSGFTCHQLALKLKIDLNIKYLYQYLRNKKNDIMDLAKYSIKLGTITKTDLNKFIIKIPKNKELIKELEPIFEQIEQLQREIKENDELYKQRMCEFIEDAMPTI